MNLLFVSSAYYPIVGGAESYAWMLCDGLTRRGIHSAIFTDGANVTGSDRSIRHVVGARKYTSNLRASDKVHWEQMYFSLLPELEEAIDEYNPQLIHANSHEAAIVATMAGRARGIPVVATFHEQSPERSALGRGRCELVYQHLPLEAIIAGSQYYYDKALQFGADPKRVRLIVHGVDTKRFKPDNDGSFQRAAWGFDDENIVVLCAGRISPRKGQLELLEAFKLVTSDHPKTRLVLAGTWHSGSIDYHARIMEVVAANSLSESVVLDASLTVDDMPNAHAAADIVVQPSHEEGLGLALLEAMATGKCVVGTNVVGIREILTSNGAGVLVPPQDIAALAKTLSSLCSDTRRRFNYGRSAREHVLSNFSIERMLQETEGLYRELLDR
jgi:glycosyltransferase involved in cell wall biosynthesis